MRSRTKTVAPRPAYQNVNFQSVRQTGMLAFLSSIQGAVSGQLAAADCWTMGRFGDFQVAQLNTNSPQGERATEKHDWDARAARLMFRHEMDHA
jgi:hypothetical protein